MFTTVAILDDNEMVRCGCPRPDRYPGRVETVRGHLPLKAVRIGAKVTGLLARATLTQEFTNSFGEPLEATYVFPLPDRWGVNAFRLVVGTRIIEGDLQERGQARREYDQAISQGHRAAIAEQERPDVFTVRAGNIAPGESVNVELELGGPLAMSEGEATLRFPLVVAPRYVPGQPLPGPRAGSGSALDTTAAPDASRVSPPVWIHGYETPVQVDLSVDLDPAGLAIDQIRCSLHVVTAAADTGGVVRLTVMPESSRLDRDFILRFRLRTERVTSSLVVHPDSTGQGATWMLTVVPPPCEATSPARDVIVVLDRSGSMQGWKIVAARRAAARLVDSLTDRDRFGIISFASDYVTWPTDGGGAMDQATDQNRYRCIEHLAGIAANGGTEMANPLSWATTMLKPSAGRQCVIVLITDGQVSNEAQIIGAMARHGHITVHTVGIDQAVNGSFLKRLAENGRGTCELVESESRLDETLRAIHRRVVGPVATAVAPLDGAGLDIEFEQTTPDRTVDVFPGVPAVIMGRARAGRWASVRITGRMADGRELVEDVPVHVSTDPVVRLAWARARVLDMEAAYDRKGERDRDQAQSIARFSVAQGVLSRFTAFVAVDRTEVVNPSGRVHKVNQPVESPGGWTEGKLEAAGFIGKKAMARSGAPGAAVGSKLDALSAPGRASSSPTVDRLCDEALSDFVCSDEISAPNLRPSPAAAPARSPTPAARRPPPPREQQASGGKGKDGSSKRRQGLEDLFKAALNLASSTLESLLERLLAATVPADRERHVIDAVDVILKELRNAVDSASTDQDLRDEVARLARCLSRLAQYLVPPVAAQARDHELVRALLDVARALESLGPDQLRAGSGSLREIVRSLEAALSAWRGAARGGTKPTSGPDEFWM